MKKNTHLFKRTILKITNPKGPIIINNKRFKTNTIGQGERIDSNAYSCHKWAMRDKKELEEQNPNLSIQVIQGEY